MAIGGYNQNWVTFVSAVLEKHGASLRSQRQRTGISHTTVASWLQGVSPGVEGVRAFAHGFGEDEGAALRAAGFESLAPTSDPSTEAALDALDAGFRALADKYGIEVPELYQHEGEGTMTPELAAFWVERMEAFIIRSLAKEAKEREGEQATVPNNP